MAEDSFVAGRYPRAFPGANRYLLDGVPSGAAGAEARVTITIDPYPQAITRITVAHSYEISAAYLETEPGAYVGMREIDDDALVFISATQQNLQSDFQHLRNFQGRGVWLPLSAPYLVKGLNQIVVTLRRLVPYPALGERAIFPTAHVTLFSVALQSDLAPGAGPPSSTGAFPR